MTVETNLRRPKTKNLGARDQGSMDRRTNVAFPKWVVETSVLSKQLDWGQHAIVCHVFR